MPRYASNLLDEPLVFDDTISFLGGQVSDVRPNLLNKNQFTDGKNVDVNTFGTVVTRKGTTKFPSTAHSTAIQGLAYYDDPVGARERLICASDGKLWRCDSDESSWTQLTGAKNTVHATNQVDLVQMVDKMFVADGANKMRMITSDATSTVPSEHGLEFSGITLHTNRLFGFGVPNQPQDAIYASAIIDGTTWDTTNDQIRIGGHSGDPIIALQSWANFNLIVFKERSVFLVNTNPQLLVSSFWEVKQISDRFGCAAKRSVAEVGGDVFYLSRFGVMSIGQVLNGAQTIVEPQPISTAIGNFIERINWNVADKACAKFWNNRYLLSVPIDGATTNNYTLVYNTVTQSWSGYWTNWTPSVFAESAFAGQLRLNFGQPDGKVLTWLEYVAQNDETDSTFKDDGVFYPSSITTRGFVFREQMNDKIGRNAEFEWNNSRALVDVYQIRDDVLTEQRLNTSKIDTAAGSGVVLPKALPFMFGRTEVVKKAYSNISKGTFNQIQFRIEAEENKIQLRGVKASAIVMGLDAEKR
tara:strand:- start:7559 stop:9139 length:1581 start_codon:yes stop_codon:yes gene_type:complete